MKKKDGVGYWGLLVAAVCGVAWLWWQAGRIPLENHPGAPSRTNAFASTKAVTRIPIRKVPAQPLPVQSAAPQPVSPPVQSRPLPNHPPVSVLMVTNAPYVSPSPPQEERAGERRPFSPNSAQPNKLEGSEPLSQVTNSFVNNPSTNLYPRPVCDVFEAQVCLGRQAISCGSIDGRMGTQTRAALRAFQQKEQLAPSGELDANTRAKLLLTSAPLMTYEVTTNDLARLQPLSASWLGKSQQSALDFETLLELVAEKSQSHPLLIRRLNPGVDWAHVAAGTTLTLPDASYPAPQSKAAFLTVHLADRTLEAFDTQSNLMTHFPCSIAKSVEKRPVGELHVIAIAPHPNYTFNPELFPESAEAHELKARLILPPGPNNPVGVAWIGLDRPGYGIHGTPQPEQIGRTESHGCFRLANWNADYLLHLVTVGTPVYVEP